MSEIEMKATKFPDQSASFSNGLQIGMLMSWLAGGKDCVDTTVNPSNVEAARMMGDAYGYDMTLDGEPDAFQHLSFVKRGRLRVVD